MRFRVLGSFAVEEGGRPVEIPRGKERTLLAALLLHANEPVSIEAMTEWAWPERPPANPPKTLQIYVSRLRKLLGAERIETRPAGYVLRVRPGELDAEEFAQLSALGRQALERGEAAEAESQLAQALSLWEGEALADVRYESFAQDEVRRLDELRLTATADLVDARLQLGRTEGLTAEIEALVRENPVWERPRAQLMLALYRQGRQAEALGVYQDTRRTLVDELGIDPSRQLRDLEQAILRQDAALAAPTALRPAESHAAPPDLVGRARELNALATGIQRAAAGQGHVFLLLGEPGIGKSRLAEEALRIARERGMDVLVGRAWEAGGAPALWPWAQALRALPDTPEPTSDDVAEGAGARFRFFEATAAALRAAAERRPIALFLDDMHAADPASLLLLRFVAREIESVPVVLIAALRDVDPPSAPAVRELTADLARQASATSLLLSGLREEDIAAYLVSHGRPPDAAPLLHRRTEGNALFVVESVRLLAGPDIPAAGEIPRTLLGAIEQRLAQLPEECRRILDVASVFGRDFPLAPLRRAADIDEETMFKALDHAGAAGVISGATGVPGQLRFSHVLVRDGLYDALAPSRRIQLHRRAIAALEESAADQIETHLAELALHAAAAGDAAQALDYAQRAAHQALRLLSYEEAARLYRSALTFAPPESPQRCELLLALGEAEHRAGNRSASKAAFSQGADLAATLGLTTLLARAAVGYGGGWMSSRAGADAQLVPLLERALDRLEPSELELRVRLLARLAGALRDERDRARREQLARQAVALARQGQDGRALAFALDGLISATSAPDTTDEAIVLASELIELGWRIDDRDRVLHGHTHRMFAEVIRGDLAAARHDLEEMATLAAESRQPGNLWQVTAVRAMLALSAGRFAEASALIDEASEPGADAQPDMARPINALQRYALLDLTASADELEPEISALAATYPARVVFRCLLVHLQARAGRREQAAAGLLALAEERFGVVPFDVEWLYSLSLLTEVAAIVDDREGAAMLYELLSPWAHLNAADPPEGDRGSVERYLGLLATTLGDWEAADGHFARAATANAVQGARAWLARTRSDHATLLRLRGQPERANEMDLMAQSVSDELRTPEQRA